MITVVACAFDENIDSAASELNTAPSTLHSFAMKIFTRDLVVDRIRKGGTHPIGIETCRLCQVNDLVGRGVREFGVSSGSEVHNPVSAHMAERQAASSTVRARFKSNRALALKHPSVFSTSFNH